VLDDRILHVFKIIGTAFLQWEKIIIGTVVKFYSIICLKCFSRESRVTVSSVNGMFVLPWFSKLFLPDVG
jgi:hypothetical protein